LYVVRGLYYQKKAEGFINKTSESDFKNSFLRVTDIYNLLKKLPSNQIYDFLWMRKLMYNLARLNSTDTNLQAFNTINSHCSKIHLKLCAIFTNTIYPNIQPTEVPHQS
jgi:hypothetical protein